jgi:beta propeller repeat protein
MKSAVTIFTIMIFLSQDFLMADDGRNEFAISPSIEKQENPDIYGDIVVWHQLISKYGDYDVFAADINNLGQPPFFHADFSSNQINPSIFENYIVWQSLIYDSNNSDWDIRMADISKKNAPSFYNVTALAGNDEQNPFIHGNIVAWEDGFPNNLNIYGADITELSNPREFPVTKENFDQRKPAIYRNTVVWQDSYYQDWDIYAADIWMRNKPREHSISLLEHDQESPAISGNTIVWADNYFGDWDIYAADISDIEHPVEMAISINTWDETNPDIDSNIIVWQALNQSGSGQAQSENWDIFAYNMTTRQTFQITKDNHDQINPAVSGRKIVWQDYRNGNSEIFGTVLSDTEAAKCTQKLAADLNNDCKVDFDDYLIMSSMWLECNLTPPEACS